MGGDNMSTESKTHTSSPRKIPSMWSKVRAAMYNEWQLSNQMDKRLLVWTIVGLVAFHAGGMFVYTIRPCPMPNVTCVNKDLVKSVDLLSQKVQNQSAYDNIIFKSWEHHRLQNVTLQTILAEVKALRTSPMDKLVPMNVSLGWQGKTIEIRVPYGLIPKDGIMFPVQSFGWLIVSLCLASALVGCIIGGGLAICLFQCRLEKSIQSFRHINQEIEQRSTTSMTEEITGGLQRWLYKNAMSRTIPDLWTRNKVDTITSVMSGITRRAEEYRTQQDPDSGANTDMDLTKDEIIDSIMDYLKQYTKDTCECHICDSKHEMHVTGKEDPYEHVATHMDQKEDTDEDKYKDESIHMNKKEDVCENKYKDAATYDKKEDVDENKYKDVATCDKKEDACENKYKENDTKPNDANDNKCIKKTIIETIMGQLMEWSDETDKNNPMQPELGDQTSQTEKEKSDTTNKSLLEKKRLENEMRAFRSRVGGQPLACDVIGKIMEKHKNTTRASDEKKRDVIGDSEKKLEFHPDWCCLCEDLKRCHCTETGWADKKPEIENKQSKFERLYDVVDQNDKKMESALLKAAETGNMVLASKALVQGVRPQILVQAVNIACENGQLDITRILLANGASSNLALFSAARANAMTIVNYLRYDTNPSYHPNIEYGLYGAVMGDHMAMVNYMLSHGAKDYALALRCACDMGNVYMYDMFLPLAYDVLKSDPSLYTDLFILACAGGSATLMNRLHKFSKNVGTGFLEACKYNRLDIVDNMMNHEWIPQVLFCLGLERACYSESVDVVEYLLSRISNHGVKSQDIPWNRILDAAIEAGNVHIATLILNQGATNLIDLECQSLGGEDAEFDTVQYLLDTVAKK